jgi:hypothetical protein
MVRYHFYDESPNKYSFTDEDLGLTTDESNFDHYDFYYNLEELQEPPKSIFYRVITSGGFSVH